ncbi:MAG: hypothetical protein EOM52_12030, partial [Clostridia bacterium]|nr:hypothetical protein [Clostridia bacterium]
MTLSFNVTPSAGIHKVEVKADDLNPTLLELDVENNNRSVLTDDFDVIYPELSVGTITMKPTETTLAEGTAINFYIPITNLSAIDITDEFRIHVAMNGQIFKTITVSRTDGYSLRAGEVKEVVAKWTAKPGEHTLKVIVDAQKAAIDPDVTVEKTLKVPYLRILYPNLSINNVNYSPRISVGKPVSFLVTVDNQSVATAFKRFNVCLYVDGVPVAGAPIDGIRGYSSVPVVLTWTPRTGGNHELKIVVDSYGELKLEPIAAGIRREWLSSVAVTEALTMEAHPNASDQDDDFLSALYCSGETIEMTAILRHSGAGDTPLTPDNDAEVYFTIKKGDTVVAGGPITADPNDNDGGFGFLNGTFYRNLPVDGTLSSGTYQLEITGSAGAETTYSLCNLQIVQSGRVTVETDRDTYQMGQTIRTTGAFRYTDGTPLANTRVVLDYQLEPRLREPRTTTDANGNEILMSWSAEEIVFVETDAEGYYSHSFTPFTGEAGVWHVNAYGYQNQEGRWVDQSSR